MTDSVTKTESPYQGIHPFRYVDRSYFCGRDVLIKELKSSVLLHRLVVLFGKSGAGKSSLINAGLIPALQKEGLLCERLRIGNSSEYPVILDRLMGDKDLWLPSVFDELAKTDAAHLERTTPLSLENLLSCASKFEDLRPETPAPTVTLIFDQFEELFTRFEPAKLGLVSDTSPQRRLTDTIVKLATQSSSQIKLLLVIREDFLADLEVMARDYPRVLDYRVRVGYLTGREAKSAVLDPLKNNQFSSAITPALANVIVRDITSADAAPSSSDGSSGSGTLSGEASSADPQLAPEPIVPPTQVQIVCRELWDSFADKMDSIGIEQYKLKGGVQGILRSFFQSELKAVAPRLRRSVILILQNLITDLGTRDVVSEKRLRESLLVKGVTGPDFSLALQSLTERRLVDMTSQRGTRFYEVASEYLIPSIQREAQSLRLRHRSRLRKRRPGKLRKLRKKPPMRLKKLRKRRPGRPRKLRKRRPGRPRKLRKRQRGRTRINISKS